MLTSASLNALPGNQPRLLPGSALVPIDRAAVSGGAADRDKRAGKKSHNLFQKPPKKHELMGYNAQAKERRWNSIQKPVVTVQSYNSLEDPNCKYVESKAFRKHWKKQVNLVIKKNQVPQAPCSAFTRLCPAPASDSGRGANVAAATYAGC